MKQDHDMSEKYGYIGPKTKEHLIYMMCRTNVLLRVDYSKQLKLGLLSYRSSLER